MPGKPKPRTKKTKKQKPRKVNSWFKEHWSRLLIIPIVILIWTMPQLQPIENAAETALRATGDVVETAAGTAGTIFKILIDNIQALSAAALTALMALNEYKKFKSKKP